MTTKLTPAMTAAMFTLAAPASDHRRAAVAQRTRYALVARGLAELGGYYLTEAGRAWIKVQVDIDHHHALSIVRRAEMSAPGYELDAAAVNVLRFYSVSEYGFTPAGPVSAVPGTVSGLVAIGLLDYRPGKYVRGIKDLVLTPAGRAAMLAHDERLAYADEHQIEPARLSALREHVRRAQAEGDRHVAAGTVSPTTIMAELEALALAARWDVVDCPLEIISRDMAEAMDDERYECGTYDVELGLTILCGRTPRCRIHYAEDMIDAPTAGHHQQATCAAWNRGHHGIATLIVQVLNARRAHERAVAANATVAEVTPYVIADPTAMTGQTF
jgi:hypothetical protein